MTLKELERGLISLSPSEKAQAIQLLAQSLGGNWQGIEKTPRVCGGEACIVNTRIPVWVLVEARRIGYSDADLLTSYPTIQATDLANAWTYATAHAAEIELAISQNERYANDLNKTTMEDIAFVKAIEEGKNTEIVSRKDIFDILIEK